MITTSRRTDAATLAELAKDQLKRDRFESEVEVLYSNVEAWSKNEKWNVQREPWIAPSTPVLRAKGIDSLAITLPNADGALLLQPIGHDIAGADGRIDLLAYPSSNRVRLLLMVDATTNVARWVARTDSGIDWPYDWNENTFKQLALALTYAPE
jgi:hypothetical protein